MSDKLNKCVWLTAKRSPYSLTEAPSIVAPMVLTTGKSWAADVAMRIDGRGSMHLS